MKNLARLTRASEQQRLSERSRAITPENCLQDSSCMPFGKYKGTLMQDVPASYLFWLWAEAGKEREVKTCFVAEYIHRNLAALKMEYTDGEW